MAWSICCGVNAGGRKRAPKPNDEGMPVTVGPIGDMGRHQGPSDVALSMPGALVQPCGYLVFFPC